MDFTVQPAALNSKPPERQPDARDAFYQAVKDEMPSYLTLDKNCFVSTKWGDEYCSAFRVKALVRSQTTQNWSRLVELLNPIGELVECTIPEGKLTGKPREAIALLSDRGLKVFNDQYIRRVLHIVGNWPVKPEAHLTQVEQIGWVPEHDAFILTSGRVLGKPDAGPRYCFSGTQAGKEIGDLDSWRKGVASLAVGNPNLIFAISLGFSTALMPFTDLNTTIFHLFGRTTKGKTRVLRAALSVWPRVGTKEKTWEGTANGLEGEIAKSHSTLMGLDELRADATPDLPAIIYKFANGSTKARGKKEGGVQDRASWNTAVLSTGEQSFVEAIKSLRTLPTGGQGVRMLDIPAEGEFGVFDALHSCETSDDFVRALDKAVKQSSGPAGAAFVDRLLRVSTDELEERIEKSSRSCGLSLQQHLGIVAGDDKTAEIRRVIASFALVAAAGEWAGNFDLTGWEKGMALHAVQVIAARWLEARTKAPVDQPEDIKRLRDYLGENPTRLIPISEARSSLTTNILGYQDEAFFYLLPAPFVTLMSGKARVNALLNALDQAGLLASGGEEKSMQFRLPSSVPSRPRAYRIRRSILTFEP
jgi:putative DNA primase/helicase